MTQSASSIYHRPIFIIGYMGSGKTTFGRALARRLGREFIDLDLYIENRFHSTVNAIFSSKGEEGFRRMEASMLREAGEFCNVVVACGGGTPCFHSNMDYMLEAGSVVFLSTATDCIVRRLIANREKRPLVRNLAPGELKEFVEAALAERMPVYSQAQIHFEGEELENAREIENSINRFTAAYDL